MAEREVSVLIGGRAGDGISSAGQVIARLFARGGFRVHMYFDYPSLVKGGHNYAIIRAAGGSIGAVRDRVDYIVALNQETITLHRQRLNDGGVIIFDSGTAREKDGTGIPVREILAAENAPPVMGNSVLLGAFVRAATLGWEASRRVLESAMPKETEKNLIVARRGYDASEERRMTPSPGGPVLPLVTGNEAIGIGLAESGISMYFSYPMSPTSNILHFLAAHADDLHIRVIQPESEIAVVLMALGASYAGSRSAIGTSGGGFCLMTESLSLAGIAELPLLIVLGQRAGPSTGLATYTAQSDLHFALHAGHGEFPRLVVAPGDAGEARTWAGRALDLAWKYQLPAILLPDRLVCEGLYSTAAAGEVPAGGGEILADPDLHPYFRYAPTASGISPLRFPPVRNEIIRVNSHVHDPDGITTEDPEVTVEMADKRMKKMEGLAREVEGLEPVSVAGDADAGTALLCWGSSKGVCDEVAAERHFRSVRPLVLWPFPALAFARAMEGVERSYVVETNQSGQLASLLGMQGYTPAGKVLKYDGRPFSVDDLETALDGVIR